MMKTDRVYILHIIDAIDQIGEYTDKINYIEFNQSRLIQDAVIRNFEIIGEAAKKISKETRKSNPLIPWKNMAGMRDKLIHNYMGVDNDAVWNTVCEILPELRNQLVQIIDDLNN